MTEQDNDVDTSQLITHCSRKKIDTSCRETIKYVPYTKTMEFRISSFYIYRVEMYAVDMYRVEIYNRVEMNAEN